MNFDLAFDRLISHEGGYVNDPNDPGQETNWGISHRAYPNLSIKTLTREQAKDIYRMDFWDRIHANELPGAVAFQTFDFAVNSGIETAVRYLQKAIKVADDGHWGPVTRQAAATMSQCEVLLRMNGMRLGYMTRLLNWPMASKGWALRISDNLLLAAEDLQ